jgi:hypothetical protein
MELERPSWFTPVRTAMAQGVELLPNDCCMDDVARWAGAAALSRRAPHASLRAYPSASASSVLHLQYINLSSYIRIVNVHIHCL